MQVVLALLIALLAALTAQNPASGQGVVLANSDPVVTIHSTFTGQVITLFGNIEPGTGNVPETGPYDVVILVRGPATDRIVREKERQFGIILNAEQAVYEYLPGYYAVLSSRPLVQIMNPDTVIATLAAVTARARISRNGARFDSEVIRMMKRANLFLENARGISFLSATTYATRIALPSNAPSGYYVAQALVIANGEMVGFGSTSFTVRTEGFERLIARTARNDPVIYGILAVIIAIGTGWLGGVLFRR